MKYYNVYAEKIIDGVLNTFDSEVAYFETEKEAKNYCDRLNRLSKKYNHDIKIIYEYDYIETDLHPKEYVEVRVDVKYFKGIYREEPRPDSRMDCVFYDTDKIKEYIKVDDDWYVKVYKKVYRVVNDYDKDKDSSYYLKLFRCIITKNPQIIYVRTDHHAATYSFEFPMFPKSRESKESFDKRCNDMAVELMKQEISEKNTKQYLPLAREGHRLTFEESDTLSGGYWSHVRAMSYMHDHFLKNNTIKN